MSLPNTRVMGRGCLLKGLALCLLLAICFILYSGHTGLTLMLTVIRRQEECGGDSPLSRLWNQHFTALLSDTQAHRRLSWENTCSERRLGLVYKMTSHARTRTAYCVVPKVSCTFWLSLFRYLHNDIGNATYRHPLDMPRNLVHTEERRAMTFSEIQPGQQTLEDMVDYFRFMFVRNPYSRLWSSYIDKHFLLDFWNTEGPMIAHYFREGDGSRGTYSGDKWRSNCTSGNITFAEFLTYIADTGQRAPGKLNEHWRPVEYLCDPCVFCPHLIGRMETFREDSALVLRQMNLTWVLDSLDNKLTTLRQLEALTKDNFGYLRGDWKRDPTVYYNCVNNTSLALQLWSAFQMYGYLPNHWTFPMDQFTTQQTEDNFMEIILSAFQLLSQEDLKSLSKQRKLAMESAYRSVPLDVLERIASLYFYEFAAFEYDPRPPGLFGRRTA